MRRRSSVLAVALLVGVPALARAGGDAAPPAGKASPKDAAKAKEVSKGPQIQRARFCPDQ